MDNVLITLGAGDEILRDWRFSGKSEEGAHYGERLGQVIDAAEAAFWKRASIFFIVVVTAISNLPNLLSLCERERQSSASFRRAISDAESYQNHTFQFALIGQ